MSQSTQQWERAMSEPHRMRLRNGIRTVNGITGETEPTYGEYVLADDYDALRSRLAEAEARLEEATDLLGFAEARLLAFGQHNSSNPDYVLAMDAIKLFLMTADSAPAVTDNCPLCGEPRADHAEIAPNGKPECRMKCKRCGDTGWLQGDPILGISDEPCGCDENWEE
jgi:ribosomal protein S27AE